MMLPPATIGGGRQDEIRLTMHEPGSGRAEPSLELKFRHAMIRWTLAYWVLTYVLLTLRSFLIPYDHLLTQAGLRGLMMLVGLAICAFLFAALRRISPAPPRQRIALLAILALLATLLYVTVNYYLFYVAPGIPGLWRPDQRPLSLIGFYMVQFLWIFPGWMLVYHYARRRLEREEGEESGSYRTELWARQLGLQVRIPVGEIEWIESEGDYVRVHRADRSYLLRSTMLGMEACLDPDEFVRIHRRMIVSRRSIASVARQQDGRMTLQLASGAELPVGRNYVSRLRD